MNDTVVLTKPLPKLRASKSAELADRALARAAGGPAIGGNSVRLLRDAEENFPAWREALGRAKRYIYFECYIVTDDKVGREFLDILVDRARAGVAVRVVVDWMGSFRWLSLWSALRDAGGVVRVFNPPKLASPLGWLTRDHRKTIVVDGDVGFVSGLCLSERWLGNPERRLEPWRDTGVELRGPAIAALERAFAQVWDACADPVPCILNMPSDDIGSAGPMQLYLIANEPAAAGTFRMDLVVASIARHNLWLTDAYFVATSPYVQALRSAARDGVDVRLLVPGASDIPALSPLSRAQYRPLLEAGVRVFEWNGTMLHAKTAVADGLWARVGSTNLNLASWLTNYELDVAVENEEFAHKMSQQYEEDLKRATEIVLTRRNRVKRTSSGGADEIPLSRAGTRRASSGSAGRVAAGAVSVGSALGAALTNRRALGPAEAGLLMLMAAIAVVIGVVAALFPRVIAWPLAIIAVWLAIAWVAKSISLRRRRHRPEEREVTARE